MKKLFILLGHSDTETLSGAFAQMYEAGAKEEGHEVRRTNIGALQFDPILHKGYKVIQELEPDLVRVQKDILWADHIVLIYPNWWNTMPALLKGFFDRAFLPGFAFKFNKENNTVQQLLRKKSARVIIVSGTYSPLQVRLRFGDYTNEIKRGILQFAGFSPVRVTTFGPADKASPIKREDWKREVYRLGKQAS